MTLKEFVRKQLLTFVTLVACISFAMGITGCLFDSDRTFGYDAFFAPIIYASLYLLLQFITYSKKELTVKQYLFRYLLQFIVYEAIVVSFTVFITKASAKIVLVLVICIPLVSILCDLIILFLDGRKAKEVKKELLAYQKKHSSDN